MRGAHNRYDSVFHIHTSFRFAGDRRIFLKRVEYLDKNMLLLYTVATAAALRASTTRPPVGMASTSKYSILSPCARPGMCCH